MSLKDYLSSEQIRLQVQVSDWRGAVQAAGELLMQAGICTPAYIQAMQKAVEDLGPYMVLAPGIALAHARPEDGVLKVGMSIINLATPVEFGSEENDPVSLVIAFGGVDHNSHIEMLRELAEFLSEDDNQELLKEAGSVEKVLGTIRSFTPEEA